MDETTKKFVEDQIEKLAGMVAKGFEATGQDIAHLEEKLDGLDGKIAHLEEKMDAGFTKLQQENDNFRDRIRVRTYPLSSFRPEIS
ncbi:MAG: hypothetical protein G01um101448_5 [Parcubacteria group bacterium Gr01-1014_48]|nr:MAG: hypothetical protein Greene041614_367 [Parcubacteria group bacterium Greene0416_14]TSC74590.1 MAG: hypothetical protein G01um101448_5 [Parcubacteria group bacterium Gr01-1014_48]TSD01611.1 MAG: hypothetical protein Greene101415_191 [Parcubacteria group bacterium Greene1014_15]TSD08340.1 MAG: hypothetical protein Greene07144_135 [Parcubacteria group bacterium Greene0714_4]